MSPKIKLKKKIIEEINFIELENDRFVEKILLGKKYYEAPIIASRICGNCSAVHNITSAKAIEAAIGITPTDQTQKLRELMLCGQMIQSHTHHLYLSVLPDFVGVNSFFELKKNHAELFNNAVSLKQYANAILETIGGRAIHPISNVSGGFKHFPEKEALKKLLEKSKKIDEIAYKTIELFAGLKFPKLEQNVIYSSLYKNNEYATYDGKILNSDGDYFGAENYTDYIYEELKPYTRTKFGTTKGREMMVGAMARMNLSNHFMDKEIKQILTNLNINSDHLNKVKKTKEYCNIFNNPFDNIIAQAIENYHFVIKSMKLIKYFINEGIDKKEPVKPPKKFNAGTAACEAPRGTLFHHYQLDKNGIITGCDIITPTVQSLTAFESNMANLVQITKDLSEDERNKTIEMLINAFDLCITCAIH